MEETDFETLFKTGCPLVEMWKTGIETDFETGLPLVRMDAFLVDMHRSQFIENLLFACKLGIKQTLIGVLSKVLDSVFIDKLLDEIHPYIDEQINESELPMRRGMMRFWLLNEYFFGRLQNDIFQIIRGWFNEIVDAFPSSGNDLSEAYTVVVSAVVLLAYVYQYLTGCVDWGGSIAYSSGSLDYRDTYISTVLFHGAYVWIKFRDVASKSIPGGAVYKRTASSKVGRTKANYEPRFKPRKTNGLSFNSIYLGQFDTYAEAEAVYRIVASYYDYGKGYGPLDLGDGQEFFPIPEMTADEQSLSGKEKVAWVKSQVKMVYECYKAEKDARNLPPTLPGADLEQENQQLRSQFAATIRGFA